MIRKYLGIITLVLLNTLCFSQAVWQVNTIDDSNDGSCNAAHCSLREALIAANVNIGPDSIVFNIPGPGQQLIAPTTPLPPIIDSFLVINANTQPGNSPTNGLICLDGINLPSPNDGLVIRVRHVKVFGLQIQRFPGNGIKFEGGLEDNLYLSNLTIGDVDRGNVLLTNRENGISGQIDSDVRIRGNYIGTDVLFTPGLGNEMHGASFDILSGDNILIGGSQMLDQQNYFCNNRFSGLHLNVADEDAFSSAMQLTGNIFGTGVAGDENLGNLGFTASGAQTGGGLLLTGEDGRIVIGGAESNTFAYNFNGVTIDGTRYKTVILNDFYCNTNKGIALINGGNEDFPSPTVSCVRNDSILGMASPGVSVFVFQHDPDICPGVPCQGRNLLAVSFADAMGNWSLPLGDIPEGADFTAIAGNALGNSSEFSPCLEPVIVRPDNGGPYCDDMIPIELIANISNPGGIQNLEWLGPGGYMSQDTNPTGAALPGEYQLVVDIAGCGIDTFTTLVEFDVPIRDTISEFCLGDEFVINGNVYDVDNTQGVEILSGAAANGCDSVIVIDMELAPSIIGGVDAPEAACRGDVVDLTFSLSGPGPFTVVYGLDAGFRDTLINIDDGFTLPVQVDSSVTYRVFEVFSDRTFCPPIIGSQALIEVSDLEVQGTISDYDGFGVSCFDAQDGTITLDVMQQVGPVEYQWNTGTTGSAVDNLPAGIFTVTVTDRGGCEVRDTFLLTEPDGITPLWDQILPTCRGAADGVIRLDTILDTVGRYAYSLDSMDFDLIFGYPVIFRDLQAGLQTVYLQDERNCVERFDVFLLEGPTPLLEIGPRIDILAGDTATLSFDTDLFDPLIQWFPGNILTCTDCPNPGAFPEVTTTVYLQAEDENGCFATDSVEIRVFIPKRVYIPNIFSPNGDGINDLFYISANAFAEIIEYFVVVDRWGNVVYENNDFAPNDPSQSWDGTLDGEYVLPGVFGYHAKIRFSDGKVIPFSGTITVVR